MKKSLLIHAAELATPLGTCAKYGNEMDQILILKDGAVYMEDGMIRKVGTTEDLLCYQAEDVTVIDATGHAVVPGFVDSHTHFVFGGYREEEFLDRLSGMKYMEIMKRGGGIASTVKSTRNASFEELLETGRSRLLSMLSQGITTVEGKSGYGLDMDCEIKQLSVMKQLDKEQPLDLVTTYLGGHAGSDLFVNNDAYIDFMIEHMLPMIKEKGLADFCDIFCEASVFGIEESRRFLEAAKGYDFPLKLHADEIISLGGAILAGEVKAISADHLLKISEAGIQALVKNHVVATLLPCTAFCLNEPFAPARKLIDSGCAVALASDLNPGSCFANSIALMLALAVINMHMTINEAVTALTLNGAAALGLADRIGSIEEGKQADLVMLDYPSYKFLVYHTGTNIVHKVIKKGEVCYEDSICK